MQSLCSHPARRTRPQHQPCFAMALKGPSSTCSTYQGMWGSCSIIVRPLLCRLDAPFGTAENPTEVTSEFDNRVVGVPDPDDDSLVWWGIIEEGSPPKQVNFRPSLPAANAMAHVVAHCP